MWEGDERTGVKEWSCGWFRCVWDKVSRTARCVGVDRCGWKGQGGGGR